MGNLTESLMGLITIAPFLIPLTAILSLLGVGMLALGIGLLYATPGILAFGLASMILIAAVPAISALAAGLGQLVLVAPGLLSLAAGLAAVGLAMMPFAMGLLMITPFLGTVFALGLMLPMIAGAFGAGGDDGGGATAGGGGESDPLLEEIKGLRGDLQAQPIQIVFDNKVISEISKVQRVRSTRGVN
tara:strand:- start:1872 stop:2435 length:564 start_codon:yes stop_codon:yes gene_type:complete